MTNQTLQFNHQSLFETRKSSFVTEVCDKNDKVLTLFSALLQKAWSEIHCVNRCRLSNYHQQLSPAVLKSPLP